MSAKVSILFFLLWTLFLLLFIVNKLKSEIMTRSFFIIFCTCFVSIPSLNCFHANGNNEQAKFVDGYFKYLIISAFHEQIKIVFFHSFIPVCLFFCFLFFVPVFVVKANKSKKHAYVPIHIHFK